MTAASVLLLGACGGAQPWHDPAVDAYVSAPLPPCPGAPDSCDPLAEGPFDARLLERLERWPVAGAAALEQVTGVAWRAQPKGARALHLDFGAVDTALKSRVVYVAEVVQANRDQSRVLSIASNGGTAVWLNGELLGASRSLARAARAHQDLYTVTLRPGPNRLLYKVRTQSAESQLHREWHEAALLPELLARSIDLGAYAGLARTAMLADTATHVELTTPQVRIAGWPHVRFSWLTLLGAPLADGSVHDGAYPARLPLPAAFAGAAVLRIEVTDTARGRRLLYLDEQPIFREAAAARLARDLVQNVNADDPVRSARVAAVRAVFGLDDASRSFGGWHRAHALADLYRHVEQPSAFHRFHGPQVWGYRAADGTVQPYWLMVPPAATGARDTASRPGLVFSITHMVDPSFWLGRGNSEGWLIRLATMSTTSDHFVVMPHLRGRHDFAELAGEELAAITRQVDSVFGIDTAAVGLLAWSAHAREAVELAQHPHVPLAWVGLAVPGLHRNRNDLAAALDSVRAVRPGVHFLLWQAALDDRIPRERTEAAVAAIRAAGFDVEYRVVPYSTHLGGFFDDIEAELNRRVAARSSGAPRSSAAAHPASGGAR